LKKSYFLVVLFAISILLAGCGSTPSWNVELSSNEAYQPDQPTVFDLVVTEGGNGVTGLQATAILEMKNMDHGTIELNFEDKGDGHYSASGLLPMSGEWEALVNITDGKNELEVLKPITIKE